jgi:tetratricopeptide (TPR) repeat protein
MKLSLTRVVIALAILVVSTCLVVSTSGCSVVNKIRAKNQLNEAARAYHDGHFEEAEGYSRKAHELDPENKTALLFIARTIHAQYKPGVQAPENLAKAKQAIEAYQLVLEKDPKSEEAYKAIAYLYGATKDTEKLRSWISARAGDTSLTPEKRAEAYIVLASQDWDCSFKITELPSNQTKTISGGNKVTITYKKPANQQDFNTAQACMKRGLEEVENAIKQDPNSEPAWSYKTNLLIEAVRLAEMDGKTDEKAQLEKQREAAQKRTTELSQINQKKKEEEEAKKAASPAK